MQVQCKMMQRKEKERKGNNIKETYLTIGKESSGAATASPSFALLWQKPTIPLEVAFYVVLKKRLRKICRDKYLSLYLHHNKQQDICRQYLTF